MDNKTQELLAKKFSKKFEEYNTKVLEELAKVIKQFDGLTYTEAYKLAQQLKYNKSYIDLIDELSKLTGKSKKEITLMLEEVINQHIEFADTFFKAQSMKTPIYKNDKALQDIVTSFVKVAGDEFSNIAKSTGFAFLDDTGHLKFMNMQETYYKVIDDCVYAISEGKETYKQAIRKTIDQLYQSGVKKIVYVNEDKQQYIQRLDAAIKRNILDGIRQVSNEAELELGKRFHADGIEVSVHSEPAPDHMYVQGHQFYNEEFEKFQSDMDCEDVKGNKYPAVSEETEHDRRSIGQYNCYHQIFSIIVGVSRPLYSDEELQKIIDDNNEKVEIDGKEYTKYEVTQLQRELERKIKQEKEAQMMYKTNNDKEMVLKHQLKVTQLTNKYKEISKKASLLEAPSKMAVSGYRPVKVNNNIILATHITKAENYKSILKEGFNFNKVNEGAGNTFGKGIYFSTKNNEIEYWKWRIDNNKQIQANIDTTGFLKAEYNDYTNGRNFMDPIINQFTKEQKEEYNKLLLKYKEDNKIAEKLINEEKPDYKKYWHINPYQDATNEILQKYYPGLIIEQKTEKMDIITGGNQIVVYDLDRIKIIKKRKIN